MELLFKETAKEDLIYWKKNNPKILKRINELLLSIKNDPYSGIGKPEALKYELSGYWSRRINKEHRLLYKVEDNYIGIYALRYHYGIISHKVNFLVMKLWSDGVMELWCWEVLHHFITPSLHH